jgi:hypothetical protein
MNPTRRRSILPGLTLVACVAFVAASALPNTACIGTQACQSLRTSLLNQRDTWAACDPSGGDGQCVVVGGDSTDCTGVLRCDFAVNNTYLVVAQTAVIDNASNQANCTDVCASPTCAPDAKPICDPLFRKCVMPYFNPNPPPNPTPDAGGGNPPPPPWTDGGAD